MTPIQHYQYEIQHEVYILSFLATDRQHILNTFRHMQEHLGYNGPVPSIDEILEYKDIWSYRINVQGGMCNPNQFIYVKVSDDICMTVNSASVALVRTLVDHMDIGELRRGERLGDFNPSGVHHFLPIYFWEFLKKYDWSQHKEQLDADLGDLQDRIHSLIVEGVLKRPKRVNSHQSA